MTEHDPFAVFERADEVPNPTPWESLANQATWLAQLATKTAALPPEDRMTLSPDSLEPDVDLLAELDSRALAVRAAVAACRRDTWRALRDRGWTLAQIADHWGVTPQAVSKALGRR